MNQSSLTFQKVQGLLEELEDALEASSEKASLFRQAMQTHGDKDPMDIFYKLCSLQRALGAVERIRYLLEREIAHHLGISRSESTE